MPGGGVEDYKKKRNPDGSIVGLTPASTGPAPLSIQEQNKIRGDKVIQDLYGFAPDQIGQVGQDALDYRNIVKGQLNTPAVSVQKYLQNQSKQLAKSNARADLRGTDTTAMNEQMRRNAQLDADVLNERIRADRLGLYGDSIGAQQEGINQVQMGYEGLGVASTPPAVAERSRGFLGLF